MKKAALKSVLAFILLSISIASISCKKDKNSNANGESSVSFKIDGVQKNYKIGSGQHKDIGLDSWWVVGSETADTTSNSLVMYVANDGTIEDGFNYGELSAIISIKHRTASGELLVSHYDGCKAYFSELGTERIKGTFEGIVKNSAGDSKTITDGVFDVARTQ